MEDKIILFAGIDEVVDLLGALEAAMMQGKAYSTHKRAEKMSQQILKRCFEMPLPWLVQLEQAILKRVADVEEEEKRLDKSFEIILNALKNTEKDGE